ncbi:hypothetical protein LLEC1_07222 [Akanthomyces lecanii]|uniref:Aminoglycoside phosphotransferase domain-containing protein n=1 Tax=Cordyceps confragosa TaxID=2714763 RepID=A0A179IHG4_CORDF|nr:hypothetical protein LLEC1_07222 [Akanthomyces lecanii]
MRQTLENDLEAFYEANGKAHTRHLATLLRKINVAALKAAASAARHHVPCRIPALEDSTDASAQVERAAEKCGGQNCNLDVVFDDGVAWMARIRLCHTLLPPDAVQRYFCLSEVATLQFLARTKVPAPKVYAYEVDPRNPVGVAYILMEKLPGMALDWKGANESQRAHVMSQLVDTQLELEKHPLPRAGSLILSEATVESREEIRVGPYAQLPCFVTPEQPSLGPFKTLAAAYSAMINQQMRMLANGEKSDLRVDNYLAFTWRLAALPGLVRGSASREGPFYLRHYDDKGDHILVDDDYNITGIIDWEWASAEAKEMAFSSPCMLWSVADFFDGHNALSPDETAFADMFAQRGRADMADMVRGGRRWQRFLGFTGGGLPRDVEEFEALFRALRESCAEEDGGASDVAHGLSYAEWRVKALEGVADDAQLAALIEAENERPVM